MNVSLREDVGAHPALCNQCFHCFNELFGLVCVSIGSDITGTLFM